VDLGIFYHRVYNRNRNCCPFCWGTFPVFRLGVFFSVEL